MCVLMLELGLTRLFSATMFYHFAFFAISLALLGSATSGLFVYFFQHRLAEEKTGTWLGLASMLFASSILFALHVILANPLTLDAGEGNLYRVIIIYLATTLPFFFAGCAITLAITRLASDASRLYLFDLAGAATGCLLVIPAINALGAINMIIAVAVVAAVAAAVLSLVTEGGRAVHHVACLLAACFVTLLIYNSNTHSIDVHVSKGKDEDAVLFSKWNSFSRVTVSREPNAGYQIRIDADAAARIFQGTNLSSTSAMPASIRTLAYYLKKAPDVLIIGAGGGREVAGALVCGAHSITAVEINPIIARDVMSQEPFKSYSGNLFRQPGVTLVVAEGRSFIRTSNRHYDVIQAAMVDTWAATAAGAFALTENNLYTVEAFKDYVTHLSDNGVLTITRWYFEPPDQPLRLLSVTRAMMSELGIDRPERHLMLIREAIGVTRSPVTFLFKKSEFSDEEVRTIEDVAKESGFSLLYTPLTRPDSVFTRMITAQDPAVVWDAYETNVAPVWDNSPFFFNTLRVSNLGRVYSGSEEWQKTNLGTFVLFVLLGITATLVVVFILGPLFLRGRHLVKRGTGVMWYLCYFGCLGGGFIIVEVVMVQKFILFLGHPVYALAVVLFSLLLFSALGSHLTGRIASDRLRSMVLKALGVLSLLVIVYILVLPFVFYGLVHLPLSFRIAITVGVIAPLAVLMGMAMPIGIRVLAQNFPEFVPWAWGVNGATSVLGSVAALVIALLFGFNQALFAGAMLYVLAILCFTRSTRAGVQSAQ